MLVRTEGEALQEQVLLQVIKENSLSFARLRIA